MDSKKQKLLIEFLISSPDTFALCQGIVDHTYFDPEFRNSVEFIKLYYEEYSTTPSPKQIEAESNQLFDTYEIKQDEVKYCADEIEKFCKHAAMKKASLALPALIKDEKYAEAEDLIKEAVMVSLTRDLGLRYFESVDERLARMLNENPTHPTSWTGIDDALFGGISRKELLLVSANSGGGKSITLANLGYNFVKSGKNVLYISLELSEDIVGQRFDTMFTGVSRRDWKDHVDKISTRVKLAGEDAGILDIVQMPAGTNSIQIRAYLKEFYLHYGMVPDLLILDYLDNMSPNEQVSADNVFEKDKRSSEQLRQIGVDLNMFVATASQLNRSAIGATDHNHSQIAGGISKINVCDVYWCIIMTDEMRAMGKIIFILLKTRNSDGLGVKVQLKWDSERLLITNEEDESSKPLVFNKKESDDIISLSEGNDGNKLTALLGSLL